MLSCRQIYGWDRPQSEPKIVENIFHFKFRNSFGEELRSIILDKVSIFSNNFHPTKFDPRIYSKKGKEPYNVLYT